MEFLIGKPAADQQEMLEYLADDFNVQLSQSGLSKLLRRRRWSRKVAERIAGERSLRLRLAWIGTIAAY